MNRSNRRTVKTGYRYGANFLVLFLFLGGITLLAYFLSHERMVEVPDKYLGHGRKVVPTFIILSKEVDDWLEPGWHVVPEGTQDLYCLPTDAQIFAYELTFEPSASITSFVKSFVTDKAVSVKGKLHIEPSRKLTIALFDAENEGQNLAPLSEPLVDAVNAAYNSRADTVSVEKVSAKLDGFLQSEFSARLTSFSITEVRSGKGNAGNVARFKALDSEPRIVEAIDAFSWEQFRHVVLFGGTFVLCFLFFTFLVLPGFFGYIVFGGLDLIGLGGGFDAFDPGEINLGGGGFDVDVSGLGDIDIF